MGTALSARRVLRLSCRLPLPRAALGLSDLIGGHLGGDDVAVPLPPVPLLARRLSDGEVGPHVRLYIVLRDAFTVFVEQPEVGLRSGDFLVRSQPILPHRLGVVLRDASPVVVHEPEAVLRSGETLVRR